MKAGETIALVLLAVPVLTLGVLMAKDNRDMRKALQYREAVIAEQNTLIAEQQALLCSNNVTMRRAIEIFTKLNAQRNQQRFCAVTCNSTREVR